MEANRIVRLLMVLKKINKKIVASWNIWLVYINKIWWCVLSWWDMSTKGHRYKLKQTTVVASLAKFVSGSRNELRTDLSKSPIQFICNVTYVTYLNIGNLCALFVFWANRVSVKLFAQMLQLPVYHSFQFFTFYVCRCNSRDKTEK